MIVDGTDTIPPGATLGVFGGGQLGRMFTRAAQRMGYRVVVFAPERGCPASQVADEHVAGDYHDDAAVEAFAAQCDAITIEFENVPVRAVALAKRHTIVRPDPGVLAIAQDRLLERAFLDRQHLPSSPHAAVTSPASLRLAIERIGAPGVLKSARQGYDGRGQIVIHPDADADAAWQQLGVEAALYEQWVDYQLELSVLVARSKAGAIETFGPIENDHADHILDVSSVPANVGEGKAGAAVELARGVAEAMQLEGLICVEMFLTHDRELIINELAPRPHNSGHLTIEAATTDQFAQQVRALTGMPLGSMELRRPAAMVNLLGDLWRPAEPNWRAATDQPGATLHLYGKHHARPGRKMGHLTVVGDSAEAARALALAARAAAVDRSAAAQPADGSVVQ